VLGSGALSYAGLDLIHQAQRKRDVTLLEVHRLGSPEASGCKTEH